MACPFFIDGFADSQALYIIYIFTIVIFIKWKSTFFHNFIDGALKAEYFRSLPFRSTPPTNLLYTQVIYVLDIGSFVCHCFLPVFTDLVPYAVDGRVTYF